MKTDTRFPIWFWMIGWAITFGVVLSQDILQSAHIISQIVFTFISLALWPLIMGFIIGDIVSFVQ